MQNASPQPRSTNWSESPPKPPARVAGLLAAHGERRVAPRRPDRPAVAATPEGHIKGAAVRALLLWYERRKGAGSLRTLYSDLPVRARASLVGSSEALGVLPSNWVPDSTFNALLDGMLVAAPCGRAQLITEGAAAIMQATVKGVHKSFFAKLATPPLYARYAQLVWRLWHDGGESRVQLVSDTAAFATLRGWPGHHQLACELTQEAGRFIFVGMGCREVVATRRACVSIGGSQCASSYEWAR